MSDDVFRGYRIPSPGPWLDAQDHRQIPARISETILPSGRLIVRVELQSDARDSLPGLASIEPGGRTSLAGSKTGPRIGDAHFQAAAGPVSVARRQFFRASRTELKGADVSGAVAVDRKRLRFEDAATQQEKVKERADSVMPGVVGTRRPTPYGLAAAERLAGDLGAPASPS